MTEHGRFGAPGLPCGGRTETPGVLRGGSFGNNQNNVRCAYRNNNEPDNRNNNNGFRIVVSTFFVPEMPSGSTSLPGRGEWWVLFLAASPVIGGRANSLPSRPQEFPGAGQLNRISCNKFQQ